MNTHPTSAQIEWHNREIGMFIHFGLYTFRDRKVWNLPGDPSLFNPSQLDAAQWVAVAQTFGARYIVFTAKHADGFCLWQTETTEFGVKSSPWKDGRGDVVDEISRECSKAGIDFGIYLSPADAHFGIAVGAQASDPGKQNEYDQVYRTQLEELLTQYGPICEVWFDGSCATEVGDILTQHVPKAMVFQSKYATIRWVGNEAGYAPYPAWNTVKAEDALSGVATAAQSNPEGDVWLPMEVDTTIRDHYWMWERDTEKSLKSLDKLTEIYYRSVGHGAVLLLNSNPDTRGLIPDPDAIRAAEFGSEMRDRFSVPVAEISGQGTEMTLDLGGIKSIDHVVSMEDISEGEVVREYVLEGLAEGSWRELARGTAIGHKKIDFFPSVEVSKVRLEILRSVRQPVLTKLSAYACGVMPQFDRNNIVVHDPFLVGTWPSDIGDEWTSFDFDIRPYCREARQYVCELQPDGEIEIGAVELLSEGMKTEGYVSPAGESNRWNLIISAFDSDYSIKITLRSREPHGSGGKVYIR